MSRKPSMALRQAPHALRRASAGHSAGQSNLPYPYIRKVVLPPHADAPAKLFVTLRL